jgi:hypothetical protein
MDSAFWASHWWLIIILASLLIPIFGIMLGAWTEFLAYRHRKAQLEVLKAYASQGKEPPEEVLKALSGRRRKHEAVMGGWGPGGLDADSREALRQEWRDTWRGIRRREPIRSWRGAIVLSALAAGCYYASTIALREDTRHAFLLAAIIVGAFAAGRLASALLVTIFREK